MVRAKKGAVMMWCVPDESCDRSTRVSSSSCVRVQLGNSSEIPQAPFHLDYYDEFHSWPISTRW